MSIKKQMEVINIKTEQKDFRRLRSDLETLRSKVLKDEMPCFMGSNKKELIEYHIMEVMKLLQACDLELESTLDDLEKE